MTKDLLVEGCDLYDNGIENSLYQHNVYTEALGITFRYNRLGPLRAGGDGGRHTPDQRPFEAAYAPPLGLL